MVFKKRDRIQIIAEILGLCKTPQTQTCIRRQTSISYDVLQSCLIQLQMRHWLLQIDAEDGQRKLAITDKGLVFLDKWATLQQLAGLKSKNSSASQGVLPLIKVATVTLPSKSSSTRSG